MARKGIIREESDNRMDSRIEWLQQMYRDWLIRQDHLDPPEVDDSLIDEEFDAEALDKWH